jgi:hypothetical protein
MASTAVACSMAMLPKTTLMHIHAKPDSLPVAGIQQPEHLTLDQHLPFPTGHCPEGVARLLKYHQHSTNKPDKPKAGLLGPS